MIPLGLRTPWCASKTILSVPHPSFSHYAALLPLLWYVRGSAIADSAASCRWTFDKTSIVDKRSKRNTTYYVSALFSSRRQYSACMDLDRETGRIINRIHGFRFRALKSYDIKQTNIFRLFLNIRNYCRYLRSSRSGIPCSAHPCARIPGGTHADKQAGDDAGHRSRLEP